MICTACAFVAVSSHLLCCCGARIGHGVVSIEPSHPSALTPLQCVLLSTSCLCMCSACQCYYAYLWLHHSPHVIWFGDWHSTVVANGLPSAVQVEGLPQSALELAAQQAKDEGEAEATAEKGPWLFTLDFPSFFPVITHSKNRWVTLCVSG